MIEEMIDSIIAAEDKAKEIVKQSVAKSNEIVSDAQKKAQEIVDGAKDGQFAREAEATKKGLEDGEKARGAQLEETQKQIDKLGDISDAKKKKVYNAIMKELKGKYGVK